MTRDQARQEVTRSRSSWTCVQETIRAHKCVSLPLPGATGANGRRQSHPHPPGGKKWHSSGPTFPIFFDISIYQGYQDLGLRNIFTVFIFRVGLWLLDFYCVYCVIYSPRWDLASRSLVPPSAVPTPCSTRLICRTNLSLVNFSDCHHSFLELFRLMLHLWGGGWFFENFNLTFVISRFTFLTILSRKEKKKYYYLNKKKRSEVCNSGHYIVKFIIIVKFLECHIRKPIGKLFLS